MKQMILFVHGYNNNQYDARHSYEKCYEILKGRYNLDLKKLDAIVYCFWPGDGSENKTKGMTLYFKQVPKAVEVADLLAIFLTNHARQVGALKLWIIAHSLGCRVTLELSKRLKSVKEIAVSATCLLAAAVPIDLCEPGEDLGGPYADHEIVLHSKKDQAFRLWFRIGQMMARDGKPWPEAVGRFGRPHPGRWTLSIPTRLGHSQYWDNTASLDVVARTLGAYLPWVAPEYDWPEWSLAVRSPA